MVGSCCVKAKEFEILEVGAFQNELLQWPLLQAILVEECIDYELLEAEFSVNRAAKDVNKCIKHV